MTVETETILIKMLEELRVDVKNIQNTLTDLKVGQARIEGKVETLEVKLEEKTKALQSGQDAINAKLNAQNTWLLSLLTALIIGILGLVAAVGKVVFFPNA